MASKFEEKKYLAEVLEELYNDVSYREKSLHTKWVVVGKKAEQATDYRTKELLWEDEEKTIPKYADEYGDVIIPDNELDDATLTKIRICRKVMADLEKML